MYRKKLSDPLIVLIFLSFVGLACVDPFALSRQQQHSPPPQPTPIQQETAKADDNDDENEELIEKIEELEKKIDEQAKEKKSTTVVKKKPVIRSDPKPRDPNANAQVNSPGDGYLALRSLPTTESGYRIMKLPHGADVRVLSCQNLNQRISGRSGRWCRVRYAGKTGWAFDAWLAYY